MSNLILAEAAFTGGSLSRLETAKIILREARSIDEVKAIRDKAQALLAYYKQAEDMKEAQNDAAEIKLRAERRAGELLGEMEKSKGAQGRIQEHLTGGSTMEPPVDSHSFSELGLAKTTAHRWQKIASLPLDAFEAYIFDTREQDKELTSAGALHLAKSLAKEQRQQDICETASRVTLGTDSLQGLISGGRKFHTIYADPPWRYENQATRASTDNHYVTMTAEEIAALPIGELAHEDAHLHMWTTNAFLFESKAIIEAWGFSYKSLFVWVKPQMGIGNYWRVSHELLLFAVKGKCPFMDRSQKSWIELDRTLHSRKPAVIRQLIEKVSPPDWFEAFGRETTPGWTVWGNEIERTLFNGQYLEINNERI